MNTLKKKGFTLIELMIVLAIIAILAVVLIPKSGIFKKNANTAGVTTNMNAVRSYLETKTEDNKLINTAALEAAMDKNFDKDSSEAIVNPARKSNAKKVSSTITSDTSVLVTSVDPKASIHPLDISSANYKGVVIVYVNSDKYVVYGVDLDGNLLGSKYEVVK